ncbi:MAG: PEGA domain-containing protein [Acidobacteriota bacterium]|nr:MAG: PEGA domain-containing protein [Acidobacteriota bacterium]
MAACLLWAVLAASGPTARAAELGAPPVPATASEAASLVELAEQQFLEVEFEQALALAEEGIEQLPPDDLASRPLLARAYAIVVQARHAMGDRDGTHAALDRALALNPAFAVDAAIAGPELARLVDERRQQLIGYLEVDCQPLACEQVLIDGLPAARPDPRRVDLVATTAGPHELVLKRHGFRDETVAAVEVAAGQTRELVAELVQVARDVAFRTRPAGAQVALDGEEMGLTQPSEDASSKPLVLRELEPGTHVLVVQLECYQRLEQRIEVVLDRLDPSPIDLGVIELSPARGQLDIRWDRAEGELLLDGRPIQAGRQSACPGRHELSLGLSGRRVWFESFEIAHGQSITLEPRPRPTLALMDDAERRLGRALEQADVNRLVVAADGARALQRGLEQALREAEVEPFPATMRAAEPALAPLARAAAPEADLIVAWWQRSDLIRPAQWLVLVDTERGLTEVTAWLPGDTQAGAQLARLFDTVPRSSAPFVGLELADRRDGPPVVATVHPSGPAASAGIEAGMLLTAIDGTPVSSSAPFELWLDQATPGESVELSFGLGAEPRSIAIKTASNLLAPNPALMVEPLLPVLARATLDRLTGLNEQRLAGALREGMILRRLGEFDEAARVLDRAAIEESVDPSGDARGTVLYVLERAFEQLGNTGYAEEVRARRLALEQARFGGRGGPPLRHAP